MNEKTKKFIIESLKYAIIIVVLLNIVSFYKSKDLNKEKLSFKSFKLIDNTNYKLSKEKPTLIYFWATWCPMCKIQSPVIDELSKKYQVLTIANQSGSEVEIEKYLKENGFSFKVINDKYNEISKKTNIEAFPTILIYDKNKDLKFTDIGYTSSITLKLKLWWAM